MPLAVAAWWLVHESGVHATIAGVALGLLVRVRRDPGEAHSPVERLEHLLSPVSAALAVPFFALMSAGVVVSIDADLLSDPVVVGVVLGLVMGKPVGVFSGAWLVARFTRAELNPDLPGATSAGWRCSPASASPCRCWSPTCRSTGDHPRRREGRRARRLTGRRVAGALFLGHRDRFHLTP